MVYIQDRCVYDAPIDLIWQYLDSEEHATAHHSSARNFESKELADKSYLITAERGTDGRWAKFVTRSFQLPPLGIVNEGVEGELAGSKMMFVYTPLEDKTQVDVFGEFTSSTIPLDDVEQVVRGWLERAYREDLPAVQALAQRRSSVRERGVK